MSSYGNEVGVLNDCCLLQARIGICHPQAYRAELFPVNEADFSSCGGFTRINSASISRGNSCGTL